MEAKQLVKISKVLKKYPGLEAPAVNQIDLAIADNTIFGLLGPNGAGKTTLLSMICGLLYPDSGRISVNDLQHNTDAQTIKKLIGLVPQDLALYPSLTTKENLIFFGSMQGLSGKTLDEHVDLALTISQLHRLANKRVATFSGGLKRRLNLAIGLIHRPSLLILDEPTVGIDPQSRQFIFDSLRQLHQEGMTIIYTTHYMEEVEQLCSEIAIIDQGKIIAQGTLEKLLSQESDKRIIFNTRHPLDNVVLEKIRLISNIEIIQCEGKSTTIASTNPQKHIPEIIKLLNSAKVEVISLTMGAINLEQLFLQLTGSSLRDEI